MGEISHPRLKEKLDPFVWLAPAIAIFTVFLLFPILFSFVLSLFNWQGYTKDIFSRFIGLKNYARLVKDPLYWLSFRNTLILVVNVVFLQNAIALILAIVIYFGEFRRSSLIRGIIFFPGFISAIIVGLVFRRILAMDGALNLLFKSVGLASLAKPWLSLESLTIWIVAFITIWQWVGYNMVIFYAGLQNIDNTLLEAAIIDGASLTKAIVRIVIPLLRPVILLSAMLNFIGGFRVYDVIWATTRGGPVHSSEVLTTYMYYQSFKSGGPSDMSYAAAIAVSLAMVVILFAALRIRFIAVAKK